jgi:flavin-dependent dehydrogenase
MSGTFAEKRDAQAACDVLVIGGGPAGATISALLAERGRDVVMIEKSRHPRFRVGESLLPLNMPLFEQLGVADKIQKIGMPKYGVEFVSPGHQRPVTFDFADAWDKDFPSAYQVRRSEFDEILFRNAVDKGAKAFEDCKVSTIEFDSAGALVKTVQQAGEETLWRTKFVVDASGRDTFLANQFGMKQRNKRHNSAALFGHFSGATRLAGKDEGNISVFWFDHGWIWFIPLSDGATSIGAVCWPYYLKTRKTDPAQFLLDTIQLSPALAARLKNATLISPVTATGNYSYSASRSTGEKYIILGDAFAFVDPVFSSGVFLAMNSAFVGAETVATCLDQPLNARKAMKAFDGVVRHGPKVFSWFIYRITTPTLRQLFMDPRNDIRLQEAVLAVLAGDIFRGMPYRFRLRAFKALYFTMAALRPTKSLMAWRRRKRAIHDAGVAAGSS